MKKYIFVLLIYFISFDNLKLLGAVNGKIQGITTKDISDKQLENIKSVEDFFYYANGNKLIQFKGDITVEINRNNIPVWTLGDYEFADKIINSVDNKFILDKFIISVNGRKLDFFDEKDLIKIRKSNIREKIENIEKNSNILKYYERGKANYYSPSMAPKPNLDMVSSEFIWISFSKIALLIDIQGFKKFEKEILSISNINEKITELKEFIEYIDRNRTLSYEEKEEEKKFRKLISNNEYADNRIQTEIEAKYGYDNTYKKIYFYMLAKDIIELNNLIKKIK